MDIQLFFLENFFHPSFEAFIALLQFQFCKWTLKESVKAACVLEIIVAPSLSKVFEKTIEHQLSPFLGQSLFQVSMCLSQVLFTSTCTDKTNGRLEYWLRAGQTCFSYSHGAI